MVLSTRKRITISASIMLVAMLLLQLGQSLHAFDHSVAEIAEECVACVQHSSGAAPAPQTNNGPERLAVSGDAPPKLALPIEQVAPELRPETRAPPTP